MIKTVRISRLKVRYRRMRRQALSTRTAIFLLTILLTILPFWIKSHDLQIQDWLSNRAVAASLATVKSGRAQAMLSEKDRLRHGRAVKNLVLMNPNALLELVEGDILSGFDTPSLLRHEGRYTLFQYQADACVLDIYLQSNAPNLGAKVVHYEVRSIETAHFLKAETDNAEATVAAEDCLRAL